MTCARKKPHERRERETVIIDSFRAFCCDRWAGRVVYLLDTINLRFL